MNRLPPTAPDAGVQLEMYRRMVRIRRFEETVVELMGAGLMVGSAHLAIGQEAAIVGACLALRDDDYIVGTHRSHGHPLGKGADPRRLMAELLGKATGVNQGLGGSMHLADFSIGHGGRAGLRQPARAGRPRDHAPGPDSLQSRAGAGPLSQQGEGGDRPPRRPGPPAFPVTVEVRLPQWGMAMQDADVVRWLKAEGDTVQVGEPLVEVEAAKVSDTVNAPVAGRLVRILAVEGATIEVAQTMAEIEPA